ncbi:HK97 family phage prohead protease [Jiella endophytica]|nr:HK97 family phage prohead protease [Jiella endophytica]
MASGLETRGATAVADFRNAAPLPRDGMPPPGRFIGYAAIFGSTDLAGDRIEPGAFAASLIGRRAGDVRMLWQHDPARPIGRWLEIVEDRTGLRVAGEFALDTKGGREAAALAAAGAIDGLSIGFRTRLARREPGGASRRLVTIDLWEISLVTFPMQELARLTVVA